MEGNQFCEKGRNFPDAARNGELTDGCDLENVTVHAANNYSSFSKVWFLFSNLQIVVAGTKYNVLNERPAEHHLAQRCVGVLFSRAPCSPKYLGILASKNKQPALLKLLEYQGA